VLAFGAGVLRSAPDATRPADAVPVGIVQGDVSLGTRWRSDFYGQNLEVYLRGTREALEAEPGALILWPEAALTFLVAEEPAYLRAIARTLAAGDGQLIAGGPRREPGPPPRYFNSVFVLDSGGRLGVPYDKRHLMPFSEYPPLGRFDFVRRRFEGARFFTHGANADPLPTRAGPAGVLVCNEAMLPELASERTAAGAAILVVPSNDTWIPSRSFAEPLFDIVRLRAVEQRRWLIRASTSGPSAIIDPWGRVQARSDPFTRATVTGWVRPERGRSCYARVGDAFAGACVLSVALALAWRGRASRGPRPATR
jgi:apolipoprotein N-acyltransferase